MEQLRFPRPAEEASAECRYAWIEARILELADWFAVSLYAYAVAQARAMGWFAGGKKPLSEAVARAGESDGAVCRRQEAPEQSRRA